MAKFYGLKESQNQDLPEWYDQLGSFYKDVILKHKNYIPNIEELIEEQQINTMSFEDLIKKHKIINVDILHIDTEGYDFEIIKTINFKKYKINVIIFENKHLKNEELLSCITLLKKTDTIPLMRGRIHYA